MNGMKYEREESHGEGDEERAGGCEGGGSSKVMKKEQERALDEEWGGRERRRVRERGAAGREGRERADGSADAYVRGG